MVAVVAMVVGGVAGVPACLVVSKQALGLPWSGAVPATMLTTALLSFALARSVVGSARDEGMRVRCIFGGAILGTLNAGLAVSLLALADGDLVAAVVLLVVGSCCGLIYGAPFGLLYGTAFLVPSLKARGEESRQTATGGERTLFVSGLWLGGVSAVVAPVSWITEWWWLPILSGALGLMGAACACVWRVRRRRWLRSVRSGLLEDWAIVARDVRHDPAVLTCLGRSAAECDEVLVLLDGGGGPYRGVEAIPMALVPPF